VAAGVDGRLGDLHARELEAHLKPFVIKVAKLEEERVSSGSS
jgi:hypothetical protein